MLRGLLDLDSVSVLSSLGFFLLAFQVVSRLSGDLNGPLSVTRALLNSATSLCPPAISFFQNGKEPSQTAFMKLHPSVPGSNVRGLLSVHSIQPTPTQTKTTHHNQNHAHLLRNSPAPFPLSHKHNEHGRTTPTAMAQQHGRTLAQCPPSYLPTQTPSSATGPPQQQQRHRTASRLGCFEPCTGTEFGPHARLLGLAYVCGHCACGHYSGYDQRASG